MNYGSRMNYFSIHDNQSRVATVNYFAIYNQSRVGVYKQKKLNYFGVAN